VSDADDLARRCVAAMWEADSASRGLGMRLESVPLRMFGPLGELKFPSRRQGRDTAQGSGRP